MQKFGVIGYPIQHSLSPIIHNFLFSHCRICAKYEKIEVRHQSHLTGALSKLSGANITLPYKENAYGLCDEVKGIAQEIEAINTLVRDENKFIGFNTDAWGFWECVKERSLKSALILGAGGSAKAIAVVLQKMGIDVSVYVRNPQRKPYFVQKGINVQEEIVIQAYDLLINATSAGLNHQLPLEEKMLQPLLLQSKCVFDAIYPSSSQIKTFEDFKSFLRCRSDTLLCAYAKRFCVEAIDGIEMLLFQALFAFEIFCRGQYRFKELKALFYN